ncbi:hypothetical protein MARCHEWKA_03940 [Brevundimonas phage vB_BpoS-Marchewka]|uniref:Uncharacterized protein n=1 Tax=Brevundimonas phage vB_BpoS-Marchewka TaxID=2948604 RepID=A0A9E7N645_9CAUD|nr:hypothetical protein MARCHEWKA_03940 [Brevundimonas phage vB_BpoS-Marchewka]
MHLFRSKSRNAPSRRRAWSPQGRAPLVGEAARVVFSDGYEHARGWVVALYPGAPEGAAFLCAPLVAHKAGPWIANWPAHQIERLEDADPYPHEIKTETDDGLTPGSKVRIYIRERDDWGKGVFVAETLGRRLVVFDGGGAAEYPAEDVTPFGRSRVALPEVKALSAKLGVSYNQARAILRGRELRMRLAEARDVEDLKPILDALLVKDFPDPER